MVNVVVNFNQVQKKPVLRVMMAYITGRLNAEKRAPGELIAL